MEIANKPDIIDIYDSFIDHKNKQNIEERYDGNESWFHASSAGMCTRKIYYASVISAEQTNPPLAKAHRLMRLGTIVHNDIQKSLLKFNKEKESSKEKEIDSDSSISSTISSSISTINSNGVRKFHIEEEIKLEDLNVRGFFDVVAEMDSGEVYLFDIKTIGSYPYKLKFGRNAQANKQSIHQELQLSTYGLAVKEAMGRIDGMFLVYYNKDSSMTKTVEVSQMYLERAKSFWHSVRTKLEGLTSPPPIEDSISPAMSWECNYCAWKDRCESDG